PHLAARADPLGLPGGATLLREERLGIGLGAECTLLPIRLFPEVVADLLAPLDDDEGVDLPSHRHAVFSVDQGHRVGDHLHSPTSPHPRRMAVVNENDSPVSTAL